MTILLLSLIALIAYGLGTASQARRHIKKLPPQPTVTLFYGFVAAAVHFVANLMLISSPLGLNFGFFNSASLITNIIAILVLLMTHKKPVQSLLLAAYPLAMATLALAILFETPSHWVQQTQLGILLHASLSIIAYSVFSVAAIQALLLYIQNKQLKAHRANGWMRALPPLQTMEKMLFEIIWAGFILLTLSILSGAIFIEDLFAQHLAHKTLLSVIAWLVFAALLTGRHLYGWRGITASRWTLGGAILLMLGYLGSKLVLELILKR